jgi:acyl transferase domain-containing protein/3-hydroxymyristoyl/3-hydroxydecanoyl-(acyl carrier protein) dehydratase
MALPPHTPLALIGMACRLPGAANLDAYWQLLVEGRCAIGELPPARLDRSLYYHPTKGTCGKTYTKIAATVDYPPLRPADCLLPPAVMETADPAHLAFCAVAVEACRHAGFDPANLPLRNVGVFVGHARASTWEGDRVLATCVAETAPYLREVPGFAELLGGQADAVIAEVVQRVRSRLPQTTAGRVPRLSPHWAAALVSQALGLSGPAMVINAACASSVQGLVLAGRALRQGSIDMAIVGGASYCKPETLILFSMAQSISAGGSRPFDAAADGLVVGEGYVSILLKTLPRALADGDRILAVIRGIGVSSDGRGKGLWAPQKKGQIEAIRRAYADPADIARLQYIEAHATSTPLGDATEVAALAAALGGQLPRGAKIPIGSAKANIGHTLEAAGLAGLVKVVLAMQKGTIPRQIHVATPNPRIDWRAAPFCILPDNRPWPAAADGRRTAAVNAFGIGGLNVHLLVEQCATAAEMAAICSAGVSPAPAAGTAAPQESPSASLRGEPSPGATAGRATSGPQPIAIIGAGCIFPGAENLAAFWDLLASPRDPKQANFHGVGGQVDFHYDWRAHNIPPLQIARANPLQFMILAAVDAALRDAGYEKLPDDKRRVGVVVGASFLSDFADQLQMGIRLPEFQQALMEVLRARGVPENRRQELARDYAGVLLRHLPALLDDSGSFTTSTLASRVVKTLDLTGDALVLDAGDVSALTAVNCAADLLRDGSCDMVLCAAAQRRMGLPAYQDLALAGGLASGASRDPLDADAQGCLPAAGAGVLVLKRLTDARRDGDRIRGLIRGIGFGHAGAADAAGAAIDRALRAAAAVADDVALAETAAAGQRARDAAELRTLAAAYGTATRQEPILVGSLVGRIGHSGAASGMASLLKSLLALEHGHMPGTFGLGRPAPALAAATAVRAVVEETPLAPPAADGRLLAAISSTDVSGAAAHLLLQRGDGVVMYPAHSVCRRHRHTECAGYVETPALSSAGETPASVAFLFTGDAAHASGMLQSLVGQFPPAAAAVQEVDATLSRLGLPCFAELAGMSESTPPSWRRSLWLLVAGTVLEQSLRAVHVRPDCVAGQGSGHYAALVASGACSFADAARALGRQATAAGAPELPIEPPRTPLFCLARNRYLAEPAEIHASLTEPSPAAAGYATAVGRLSNEGIGVVIEVGAATGLFSGAARIVAAEEEIATRLGPEQASPLRSAATRRRFFADGAPLEGNVAVDLKTVHPSVSANKESGDESPHSKTFPLIDAVVEMLPGTRLRAELHLDPAADPFLREHRFKDKPILPAVIGLEAFVEAATLLCQGTHVVTGVRDFHIHRALQFVTARPLVTRITAEPGVGGIACRLTADFHDRQGRLVHRDREYLSAVVEMAAAVPPPRPCHGWPLAAVPRHWERVIYPGEVPEDAAPAVGDDIMDIRHRETVIFHGSPLRCMQAVKYEPEGGWARIVIPTWQSLAGNRRGTGWLTAPELLDACLLACGVFMWNRQERTMRVPQAIERLQLGRRPTAGQSCTLRLDCRPDAADRRVFDLVVADEDGMMVLEVEGYQTAAVSIPTLSGKTEPQDKTLTI